MPNASNLNYLTGDTVPNSVITGLGAAGAICIFTSAATHLIVDVAGYFADTSRVHPARRPARVLDSRPGGNTVDGQFQRTGVLRRRLDVDVADRRTSRRPTDRRRPWC